MTKRCILTKEEVVSALARAALEKTGLRLPPGAHPAVCRVLTMHENGQAGGEIGGEILQARVELEFDEVLDG